MDELSLCKKRYRTVFHIATEAARSLNIGEILEVIRDEIKNAVGNVKEVCFLMLDPEAIHYTRPLHCAVHERRINCQLCKRGRSLVRATLARKNVEGSGDGIVAGDSEVLVPIRGDGEYLAVLSIITKSSTAISEADMLLIKDLALLSEGLIASGRKSWKAKQEKLTAESILAHLKPFVPETVRRIVERNPQKPELKKTDQDVSILFLDVAGYTTISEAFSREQVLFLIEKYFSAFLDIITFNNGDVNETAGDGLMSIFSGAKMENAENAAKAGSAIRERTREINRELAGRFQPVVINMGINSGPAAVGMTRFEGASGLRMTYTASGETTNLAARIAGAAKNGDILLGPETADRLRQRFEVEAIGEKVLKNVSRPIFLHRLV